MTIVHIIQRDKFTYGYIDFMNSRYCKNTNVFFTNRGSYTLPKDASIIEYSCYKELLKRQNREYFEQADKIIISGVSIAGRDIAAFSAFSKKYINKTYFHFWGKDYYRFKKNKKDESQKMILQGFSDHVRTIIRYPYQLLYRFLVFSAFRASAGLVFVIDGEYEVFNQITGVVNQHYVAPMPGFPDSTVNYKQIREVPKRDTTIKILIGNSATASNRHLDVFNILKDKQLENVRLYCPLSYGDDEYRDKIYQNGRLLLGERFAPIIKFMQFEEYIRFLATMDVGIFYNDRQQALGNIIYMLLLGKKVYLREGTTVWENFNNIGLKVFPCSSLVNESIEDIFHFDAQIRQNNIELCEATYSADADELKWNKVIYDN